MEQRVEKLEEEMVDVRTRLTAIELRLTSIETLLKSYPEIFATKAELLHEMAGLYARMAELSEHTNTRIDTLHKAIIQQTWRIVTFVAGAGALLTSIVYFLDTHAR